MPEHPLAPERLIRLEPGAVVLLDQRALPEREIELRVASVEGMVEAISTLAVRGAPAIGIAAAMALCLAARDAVAAGVDIVKAVGDAADRLRATRPTAVNLAWGLDSQLRALAHGADDPVPVLERNARELHAREVERCREIGAHGAPLIRRGARVLTHCNAGALATGGYGSALGVVRAAHERDPTLRVVVDETRPLLQGARLTTWELERLGIGYTLICDSMAAAMMAAGRVSEVIIGADRIAANGDVANKVGSYGVALAAREHGIPFLVAAPTSTLDLSTPAGRDIVIEERAGSEVRSLRLGDLPGAPSHAAVANPAFDVTPARLVSAIITERGVHRPPYERSLAAVGQEP